MTAIRALLAAPRSAPVTVDADGRSADRDETTAAVSTLARRLRRTDVLVACTGRVDFVHAVLAAWTTNRRVVLPPNLQPQTLAEIAAASDADLLDDRALAASPADAETSAPSTGFVRLFTSGSTGAPRAIDKAADQLLGEARVLADTFAIAGQRVLCTVPFGHIYGLLFGVLVPLTGGATIVGEAPLHAEAVLAATLRHQVDVLCTTPAQLRSFAVLDRGALSRLSRVFSSGAPLPAATAAMLRERHGIAVTEVLGSSETGGVATRTHDTDAPRWRALPQVEITADADGRMHVRAPWTDRPDALVATEDRIELEGDGFIHRGRIDDVVKIAGRRVALGDVLARTLDAPGVEDAAACVLPATDGRGATIGLVAAGTATAEQLREHLAGWLEPTVLPRPIVCVPRLDRDATGKLPRARLLALLGVAADETVEVDLVIDPAAPCFVGHFPGDPIYPGAVLLDEVVCASVARTWPRLGAPRAILRAKFSEPIRPGDALQLRLVRRGEEIAFDVRRGGISCASGRLRFAADARADPMQ